MVTARGKVTAREKPAAVAHQSAVQNRKTPPRSAKKKHKKHKRFSRTILCLSYLLWSLVAVASSLLRGGFSFLFFVETFLIFLDPHFEIGSGFFELVAV